MNKLYALLVGINKYQSPVVQLKGCVNDANRVEKYLQKNQGDQYDLHIKKLTDEEATYQNILDGFRSHLRLAGEDDMVWFHFSGHGSEEKTAPEFLSIEPNGKDQTMLCYDSLKGQAYNIADKEMAVLLHEVSTSYPDSKAKTNSPHILVSLDCCHSGSGTRDAGQPDDIGTRHSPTSNVVRPIESYVKGYYSDNNNFTQIPASPHVLLSACQSYQLAGDLSDGGAFTSGLLRALKSSKGEINYADLFIRTRASVKNIRPNQLPNFTTLQNFDPYTRFLGADRVGKPEEFEVFYALGKWMIKCGAINGLPTDGQDIEVEIRSVPPESVIKGKAKIISVGAQQSELDMNIGFGIKQTIDAVVPGEDHYRGVLKYFPAPPEQIFIHGDDKKIKALKDNWDVSKNINYTEDANDDYLLQIEAREKYTILDRRTNKSVFTSNTDIEKSAQECVESLGRMVKWHRLKLLENKNKKSKLKDRFVFEVDVYDATGNITTHTGPEIKLYATEENSDNGQFGFNPKVKIKDMSQDLFFYLLYLRPNYAVECPDDEVPFKKSEFEGKTSLEMNLWKQIQGFGPDVGEEEVTAHFKLLCTTEKLDYYQFLQSGLGNTRSGLTAWNPSRISNDWTSVDVKITIARQDNQVSPSKNISLAHGALEVMAHPSFNARINVATAERDSRSVDVEAQMFQVENKHFQLMNLSQDRNSSGSQIIELNNIKPDEIKKLKNDPLKIIMNTSVASNEYVIPVVHDGQFFRIAGTSDVEDNKLKMNITNLPEKVSKHSDEEMGDRSILSSFKLAFYKVVLNRTDTYQLRMAVANSDGDYALKQGGMAPKLMGAKTILILIHGLIGDGDQILADIKQTNPDVLKNYDVVLTFDYESLSTSLDESAANLDASLKQFNLDQHEKQIDIIAHSTGGLIARWLIEQTGWGDSVRHLTMLGTPNNGSLYGKVEDYRMFAIEALELIMNFMPKLIPGAGIILKGLGYAKNMTVALGQISPDSKFLNQLNTSTDPKVPYTIMAGDASNLETTSSDMMVKRIYKNAIENGHSNQPNDLFATIESVKLIDLFQSRSVSVNYIENVQDHHFGLTKKADKLENLIAKEE